ncbi:gamma-glutamyl-gamma-aminobutyrate hydrolase family protein [Sphingobacterium spiritivorum]|uniref:glutamine amidotransferase-related protein n=1 Tax=Sphingobacterium spiritivorum TaxID=258 RepID=UPI0036C1A063
MHIHFVQHEHFEAPGAYLLWAMERQYTVSFSKLYDGDLLPDKVDDIDLLIVMGGPQSPNTTIRECPHFDAEAEIFLIQQCAAHGKAVVGVCLGAQLIGEAMGGKYAHNPEKEIGVFPMMLTPEGLQDEKIAHFGTVVTVGHWHNDMPGLTTESKRLASSEGCPRQIVAYGNLLYGFQCHMELTPEVVELLIAADEELLNCNHTHRFIQKPEDIRSYDFTEMNSKLYGFLDKLMMEYAQKVSYTD